MIIIDYSNIAMATVHVSLKMFPEPTEANLRHLILNTIRNLNNKFGKRYGQPVLAIDSRHYWRKDIFPYYKWKRSQNRKKDSDENGIDWNEIYGWINNIKEEVKDIFPYRVIESHGAEADDVVGVLTKHVHLEEKVLICANDGDYKQLQQFKNVSQWNPIRDEFVKVSNPRLYLSEHILRGDTGDGICNILSPNDSFYTGTRQKACGPKKIADWIGEDPKTFCDTPEALARYYENEQLIDLTKCPSEIACDIIDQYDNYEDNKGDNSKIVPYLMSKQLVNLLDCYTDFYSM